MTANAAFQNPTEWPFQKWKEEVECNKNAKPRAKTTKRQNAENLNDVIYPYYIQPEKGKPSETTSSIKTITNKVAD